MLMQLELFMIVGALRWATTHPTVKLLNMILNISTCLFKSIISCPMIPVLFAEVCLYNRSDAIAFIDTGLKLAVCSSGRMSYQDLFGLNPSNKKSPLFSAKQG